MKRELDCHATEKRFRTVFSHLGAVTAYARRRGSKDADAIAAEVMTIAWRRLGDVPTDDPRPWLYATARNLVWAEARGVHQAAQHVQEPEPVVPPPDLQELDPDLIRALRALSRLDLEALLLVAWDDLTPRQAAKSLGIKATAFRVRLLRARRRLHAHLNNSSEDGRPPAPVAQLDVEGTQ
jgi:RNA polymerase sigma factor (sigma-70 family)